MSTKKSIGPTGRRTLPKTIRVGIFTYMLEDLDAKTLEAENAYGICNRFDFTIKIFKDLPDQLFAEVLTHEIVHACWDACKLGKQSDEETAVSSLTPYLMMVRRDNPKIFSWIDQVLAKK